MISCIEYDHIEIVCMFQYPVKLTLKNDKVIKGVALDTQYNDQREECLKIKLADSEEIVVLESILILEVCIENPHFRLISFT